MGRRLGSTRGIRPVLLSAALVAGLLPGAADASQSDNPFATRALSFQGTSPDGTHAYIQTPEQLVAADTDQMVDVYDIDAGVAKLVSIGPNGGNRNGICLSVGDPSQPELPPYTESCDARFQGASGDRIYFRSESLRPNENSNGKYGYYKDGGGTLQLTDGAVAETEDNSKQIVQDPFTSCLSQRTSSGSTLISTGPAVVPADTCPSNGDFHFVSQTPDGSSVFFYSKQPLTTDDQDSQRDLYMSRGGATTLISTGPTDDGGAVSTRYGNRVSPFGPVSTDDGDTAVFTTAASLTADDQDGGADDIYLRSGSTTTLVSGTAAIQGTQSARLEGQSDDLGTIFFETNEALVPEDTNTSRDVYRWKNGAISLAAVDPDGHAFAFGSSFLDASVDGTKMFFYAWQNAAFATGDIYQRSAGTTIQLSSPGSEHQYWSDWVGASDDGSKVYFDSRRTLTGDDDDGGKLDLFRYQNGTLTLISADSSPIDPEDAADASAAPAPLDDGSALSGDGSRIYFKTTQSMSPADTDCGRTDYYEHSDSGNHLVTVGADAPTIASGPCAFDTNEPTFHLEPANPGGALECRIDQEAWELCASSFTPEIDNGEHVLYVRGHGPAGAQSGVADRRFTVAAPLPPETTITAGPDYAWDFQNPNEYRRPAFSFISSQDSGHFECRFDGGAFELCDQSDAASTGTDRPDEPLSWGKHTFEVRAVDGAGNADPTPGSRTFTMARYDGDLELEISDPGMPKSMRRLGRDGIVPTVRCSEACRVRAKVTLSFKSKGKRRSISFGSGRGASGLDSAKLSVSPSDAARRALRKSKRASLRIVLTGSPSDGNGAGSSLTRVEKLPRRNG